MIDTIKLFSANTNSIDLNYVLTNYDIKERTSDDYYSYSTQIDNMSFWYDNNGVHIEGSAPKFLNGNNVETLKFHEVPKLIYKLSNAIGSDISGYTVTRLDITDNLTLSSSPKSYKRYFGKCRYFQKVDYDGNGVQYVNNTRKLTLYDKLLELSNKSQKIPTEVVGKNLLRYEYSIMKKRKQYLNGINCLTDLTLPEHYLSLIDKWEEMFNKIEKISFQSNVSMPYMSEMKPANYYMLLGVYHNGGINNTMREIEELMECGAITRSTVRTFKRNVNKFQGEYNCLAKNGLIDKEIELKTKFCEKVLENKKI